MIYPGPSVIAQACSRIVHLAECWASGPTGAFHMLLSLCAHLSICQYVPPQGWWVHSSMIIPACMYMQSHSNPPQAWQAHRSVITLVCECLQACTCDIPRSQCYCAGLLENSTSGRMVGRWAHWCLSHAHSLSRQAHSSMCQYAPLQVVWAHSSTMIPSRFIYAYRPAHVIHPDPSIVEQACLRIVCLF